MTRIEVDNNGRPYALVSEVKDGDLLIADGGFVSDPHKENFDLDDPATREKYKENIIPSDYGTDFYCIMPGSVLKVCHDEQGLYVPCFHEKHYLDGQYEDRGGEAEPFYMGFYK